MYEGLGDDGRRLLESDAVVEDAEPPIVPLAVRARKALVHRPVGANYARHLSSGRGWLTGEPAPPLHAPQARSIGRVDEQDEDRLNAHEEL